MNEIWNRYVEVWKKYAVFKGRARRKEFFTFAIGNMIVALILSMISDNLLNIFQLASLIPSIAVGVRRIHDTGHNGWWYIVPIVNLVFFFTNSQPGDNKYGPNPKAPVVA